MVPLDDATLTVTPHSGGIKLRTRRIRVEVARGPDVGIVVELPGPDARVGSGEDCDVTLTDPTVSRLHLRLCVESDRIRVIDPGSKNGTIVDGIEIRDAYARPDSSIVIGGTTLRLRMLSSVVELPLSPRESFGLLLGKSAAMRRIFAVLERVALGDETLLVEGETGTGKELVARGVHDASRRAGGPFVVLDCSAVSRSLVESELFGHLRGSFTGAVAGRPGAFEEADGGTLFLDEIGELPLDLQPKLLRALEAREVRRLGENRPRRVDVRVVAATNRALSRAVDHGAFREDLYYRLAVIPVRLPPLRERVEDIPLLVRRFEEELAARSGLDVRVPPGVVASFTGRSWPGNVRELRNAVSRVLSLGAEGAPLDEPSRTASLPGGEVSLDIPLLAGRARVAGAYERAYLELALKQAGGNISRAAQLAGVGRKFVQDAMKRHGLRSPGRRR